MPQGTAVDQGQTGQTFAGAQVTFDIITHGTDQYFAHFNPNRDINIWHRTLGATDGPWTSKAILESTYNPDVVGHNKSYKASWDSHCWLRLGVDFSGNVHLSADHHASEFRYWRTTTPGDLSTLTRYKDLVYTGPKEDQVTYPEFINNSSGHMKWLMFRDGVSGNGIVRVYEWNNTGKTWSEASVLFTQNSPYFGDTNGSAYTETYYTLDGWYHIVFCWREGGLPTSNTKLSYVKTQDFRTYSNAAGVVQTLPIAGDANGCTVDPVAGGSPGFVNGEWQFIKVGTTSFIAYVKASNLWVARFDDANPGLGWQTHQMTTVAGVGGLGNGFPDNYISMVDANTLAVDYALGNKGPTQRVVFPIATWNVGTFTPVACPQYFPDSVYPAIDTQPGINPVYSRTRADSKGAEQTNGLYNRTTISSRPYGSRQYVASWLCGPEYGDPPVPAIDPAVVAAWPNRSIHIHQITLP